MIKHLLLTGIIFLYTSAVYAQSSLRITGIVKDKVTQQAVEMATIQLLKADSSFISGVNTTKTGSFSLSPARTGNYLIRVTFVGYKPSYHPAVISDKKKHVSVGTISLEQNEVLLQEATVVGKAAAVEMKEDTMSFNASAFKVEQGEMLEELVKKLPGVEISDNGTITINGKTVKEFRVNGKDFFKGKTDVAMKNLPVDLVKKIKTYEKKSDYTEQTGIDDGQEQTVMDVQLKKELNETWMSNLRLGAGSEGRYQNNLFVNRTTDRSRISLTGSANNSKGTSKSQHAGFDFSWDNGKKHNEAKRLELGGYISVPHNSSHNENRRSSETFLSTGSSFSNSWSENSSGSSGVSGSARVVWSPDTLTTLIFTPNFNLNSSSNNSSGRSATFNADPYKVPGITDPLEAIFAENINDSLRRIAVNRNDRVSMGHGREQSASTSFMLVRRMKKKGRNITFDGSLNYSNRENESFSISDIRYYQPDAKEPVRFSNQYTTSPSKNMGYATRLSYSEPIFKNGYLQAHYRYSYQYSDNDRSLYQLDSLDGWKTNIHPLGTLPEGDSLLQALDRRNSQYATYKNYNQEIGFSFRWTPKDFFLNLGLTARPEKTKMDYLKDKLDTTVVRNIFKITPNFHMSYRFSKTERIEIRYNGSSSQPSMTNLLDITDDSNPLYITKGNPGLKPSWTNHVNLSYNRYNIERQQGWNLNAGYSQTSNSISNSVIYNETTGVRTTKPENINGNWSTDAHLGFNSALGEKKSFNIYANTSFNYNNSVGYISNDQQNSVKNTTRSLSLGENLRGRYRNDWLELEVSGRINYQHARNELRPTGNLDTYDFRYGMEGEVSLPWKMKFSTDFSVNGRRGFSNSEMNRDECIWNLTVSQKFLKQNAATLSIRFYDILQQRSDIRRTVNAQERSDVQNYSIYSYFMVRFTYRLNIFNGKIGGGEGKGNKRGQRLKQTH